MPRRVPGKRVETVGALGALCAPVLLLVSLLLRFFC